MDEGKRDMILKEMGMELNEGGICCSSKFLWMWLVRLMARSPLAIAMTSRNDYLALAVWHGYEIRPTVPLVRIGRVSMANGV